MPSGSGNIASRLAIDVFVAEVKNSYKPSMSQEQISQLLRSALDLANVTVYEQARQFEEFAGMGTTLVAALLSGLGLFEKIAKRAGGGTLVPITGFANSVVSPAIDSKSEGFILGVGAKLFSIAGPVIVYGVSASVVYGLIYWITTLI